MAQRTTREDDFNRLAERVNRDFGKQVVDGKTANRAFDLYMEGQEEALSPRQNTVLRRQIVDRLVFMKAGGKSLSKDRQQTAKTVLRDSDEFVIAGAKKTDLDGLDTRGGRKVKRPKPKSKFVFKQLGKVKQRTVYGRPVRERRGTKFITRFRDRKGRYIAVKKAS